MTSKKSIVYVLAGIVVLVAIAAVWRTGALNTYLPFFLTTDGWSTSERKSNTPQKRVADLSYVVGDELFSLQNGVAEIAYTPESATKNTVRIFGEPVYGDLNNDGDALDAALWLENDPGGSGTFYYAALALHTKGGYAPTGTVLLGDRIAPQTVEIRDGRAVYHFAERREDEPMTTPPSWARSVWIHLDPNTYEIGEWEKAFEGESSGAAAPTTSTVVASYTDGTLTATATFDNVGGTVTVSHRAIGTVTLPLVRSASGARYANANESIIFWEHQGEATITKNGKEIFHGGIETNDTTLAEREARIIAEKSCIKGGEVLSAGSYNEGTKTWWFDANLNATREGCNPACVVSEETRTAELNWRCTGLIPPDQTNPTTPVDRGQCGIENCHGLDIVCGDEPAQVCTMEYRIGDICRQYAACGVIHGTCQQIENAKFSACKACVNKCENDLANAPYAILDCEQKCAD